MGPVAEQKRFDNIPDSAFFAGACVSFLAIAVALAALAGTFSGSIWSIGDTRIFYRMADLIVQGGTPYVDFKDPKPPLIFFLLAVPQALGAGIAGGLLLAGFANFISAVVIMKIGWRLYGRGAGLLAGLLFVVNAAWAQGYFVLTEPFALAFLLLSVYFMLSEKRHRYLLAGICAGLAIGFKQYTLLIVPLSLFYMFRKGERGAVLPYLAGALLPLAVMFAAMFAVYGADAGFASLYWSFGMAPEYLTQASVGDVPAYQISSPVTMAIWIVTDFSLFTPLLVLAAAGAVSHKRRPEEELFIMAAIAFAATLLIRPFLHYWTFTLPFASLLAASAFGKGRDMVYRRSPSGNATYALFCAAVFTVLLSVSALATYIVVNAEWRPRAIQEFYGLADVILKSTVSYFGHRPEHVAIGYPLGPLASLLVLTALCLITSVVVAAIAWKRYGRGPALLAGTLLSAGIAFALGVMQPSDGLAMLLLGLSLYSMTSGHKGGYLASGLLVGMAIVIKPFAIVLVPAALFMLLRSGKQSGVFGFAAGMIAPVALFGLLVSPEGMVWGVSLGRAPSGISTAYLVPDALMAMINLAAAGSFATVTAIVAVAAFLSRKACPFEEFLAMAVILLFCTLIFREYVHYWFLALPFAALLCARLFSDDRKVIIGASQ
jgi:4-amino-4-deoxy-L-arabinose transferase-like glycosyltransferase